DRGDRRRRESLPERKASHLVGWYVSPERRERGQEAKHADPAGRTLAENNARAGRVGRRPEEELLFALAVLPDPRAARSKEGDHRRRGEHADSRVPHAPRPRRLPRPRPGPLRPTGQEQSRRPATSPTTRPERRRSPDEPSAGVRFLSRGEP